MSRAITLALLVPALLSNGTPRADDASLSLTLSESDGQALCSVRTENASLERVLATLAERGRVRVEGLDPAWERLSVTADLHDRPLSQAISYVLGSVGLRADMHGDLLVVRSDAESTRSVEDANAAALATYMRVLRDFPKHPAAPQAELRQAQIEDQRGNPVAARAHFDAIAANYPDSPLAAEALLDAGEAAMRNRDWQAAATSLLSFMRKSTPVEMQARGRLALARSFTMLGQHERALYALDAVEALHAETSAAALQDRQRVRVRALAGLGRGQEALTALGEIEQEAASNEAHLEMIELRALACDAAQMPSEAARAWLAFSQKTEGPDRRHAMECAAARTLASGNEVGVLFIAQLAHSQQIESADLACSERAARAALSLSQRPTNANSIDERIADAEQAVIAGDSRGALDLLRKLGASRATFTAGERSHFDQVHVRAIADQVDVDAALEQVRTYLADERDEGARRALYVLAAELLERAHRFDDAIDAYQGRL